MDSEFLKAVEDHEMSVVWNEGNFRHLTFARLGTSIYAFQLTTWPGYLAITGDMGSYVFCRAADMFKFFRGFGDTLPLGYFAEKCVAEDTACGIRRYSPTLARKVLADMLEDYKDLPGISEELQLEVMWTADEGEHYFREAVRNFNFGSKSTGDVIGLDLTESDLREFTPQFQWCCQAIVWGIGQYDRCKP